MYLHSVWMIKQTNIGSWVSSVSPFRCEYSPFVLAIFFQKGQFLHRKKTCRSKNWWYSDVILAFAPIVIGRIGLKYQASWRFRCLIFTPLSEKWSNLTCGYLSNGAVQRPCLATSLAMRDVFLIQITCHGALDDEQLNMWLNKASEILELLFLGANHLAATESSWP